MNLSKKKNTGRNLNASMPGVLRLLQLAGVLTSNSWAATASPMKQGVAVELSDIREKSTKNEDDIQRLQGKVVEAFGLIQDSPTSSVSSVSSKLSTVVTAFFSLGNSSKYAGDFYSEKMKDMLMIDAPVIIHTDQNPRTVLQKYRKGKEAITRIIAYKSVTGLPLYSKYGQEVWDKQIQLDKEKEIHKNSFALYLVWNSKAYFLKHAVEQNYWNSQYYFWVDIGSMRRDSPHPAVNRIAFTNWPDDSAVRQIPDGKMLFMYVEREADDKGGRCSF
jgi:hypothetical protein